MALEDAPYADIVEVRNVGRRRANIYLTNGWTLLGWEMEQRIARRDGPPDEAGIPQPMHIKLAEIMYVLGRSEAVEFEGDDIFDYERAENLQRREEETERAAKAVDEGSAVEQVEADVRGAVAKFRRDFDAASRGEPPPEPTGRIQPACEHDWVDPAPEEVEAGRSCGKCGAVETTTEYRRVFDEPIRGERTVS